MIFVQLYSLSYCEGKIKGGDCNFRNCGNLFLHCCAGRICADARRKERYRARSKETPTAEPLWDLLPPKGRGAKAEINLVIVSDSLPLGTPSLTAKPRSREIANQV